MADYAEDLATLDSEMALLLATIESMTDAQLRADSELPDWTRGHVLAHIDGNARGLARLARSAIDDVPRSMYQSPESRTADIEWRASRDELAHLAAVQASGADLRRDLAGITPDRYARDVRLRNGWRFDAREVALLRLQEVSVHHSDLGLPGYTWRDWPARLIEWRFDRLIGEFQERGDLAVDWIDVDGERIEMRGTSGTAGVTGSRHAVMAWLTGRSGGDGLVAVGIAAVPSAPTWL